MAVAPQVRISPLAAALGWTPREPFNTRTLAVAALGMSVPALAGLALHRPEIGFTIGLGALLLADTPSTPGLSAGAAAEGQAAPGSALLPATLAVALATFLGREPWSDVAMVGLAGMAAAISSYSRPVGGAAIRFIIYFVLSFTLLRNAGGHRGTAALVFGLGALWNILIRLLLVRRQASATVASAPPARAPTAAQRRAHFRRTLRALSGWQFPIRIVVGLALADGLRLVFPSHHYGWIVLTVALLTQRPIEHLPVKTLQRAAGTAAGVALTWGIVIWLPPPMVLGVTICLLATAASVARSRNYLLYSALSTPVILLVLDLGKPIQTALLTDRLVATAVGAAIVVALNVLMDRLTRAGGSNGEKPLTRAVSGRPTRP